MSDKHYSSLPDTNIYFSVCWGGMSQNDLFLQTLVYRDENQSTRYDKRKDKRPVNLPGTDKYHVAEENPKKDEQNGLRTIKTTGHFSSYEFRVLNYELKGYVDSLKIHNSKLIIKTFILSFFLLQGHR